MAECAAAGCQGHETVPRTAAASHGLFYLDFPQGLREAMGGRGWLNRTLVQLQDTDLFPAFSILGSRSREGLTPDALVETAVQL